MDIGTVELGQQYITRINKLKDKIKKLEENIDYSSEGFSQDYQRSVTLKTKGGVSNNVPISNKHVLIFLQLEISETKSQLKVLEKEFKEL